MIKESYSNIKDWYEGYLTSFNSEDSEVQLNFELKKAHSLRVSELIRDLGENLNLIESDLLLAECIGLLHDVGRFEQLAQYGTLADTPEVNHSEIGISVLEESQVLDHLDEAEKEVILGAIKFHNLDKLPKINDKNLLFFSQLLRDADKLDVFQIVADYYNDNKAQPNKNLEMNLPENLEISKKVYDSIMNEKTVDMKYVATLNDYKLLQMSWIFDLNIKRSFQIVNEKSYLKKIYETMPKRDEVIDMYRNLKIYMENQL
ncbi:MAG: HD domain-containing protein [Marinifilaceae bacterium]